MQEDPTNFDIDMPPSQGVEYAEVATQQPAATQEAGANTQLISTTSMSEADELDIICTLFPTTPEAFEIVQRVAERTPAHVLRNHQGLPSKHRDVLETYQSQAQQLPSPINPQATPEINTAHLQDAPGEIALRLSTPIKDMDMGFTFGRDARKVDIVLEIGSERIIRISGMHCRIYLKDNGMVMLEDTSTNGTIVDGMWLKCRSPNQHMSVRRVLGDGSIIEIAVDDRMQKARFIVKFPERHNEEAWNENLQLYLANIKRAREAKNADLVQLAAKNNNGAQGTTRLEVRGAPLVTAGTMKLNHGMRWTGGGKYKVIGKIGQGAFATVYKLVESQTGAELAAKELDKRRIMKNGVLDVKISTELEILKTSNHEHVIKSFDHHEHDPHLYIVMEYMPYGDLSDHLMPGAQLSDHDNRCVAKQMCHALAYLHDKGIAHRDIKPENILKKSRDPIWIKLADFGLSKIIEQGDNTVYQTFCGTFQYLAPEVYPGFSARRGGEKLGTMPKSNPNPYSVAVDIWSLAAVMFQLVCGVPPYQESAANMGVRILDAIFEERFPQAKLDTSGAHPDWESFLINSLQLYAAERWSARRLLKLPFFQNVPDVVEIDYEFQTAEKSLAFQEDSSDEEMSNNLDTIPEEAMDHERDASELDASRLSIYEERNESSDHSMSGVDDLVNSHTTGLGIQGIPDEADAGSRLPVEEASRYNLRARGKGSRQGTAPTPAVPQEPGKLFGEIAESGVFGSAANTPRIVKPAPFTNSIFAAPMNQASVASEARAEDQRGDLIMTSSESDGSDIEDFGPPVASTSMKHPRHSDEESLSTSVKRPKVRSSAAKTSQSNVRHGRSNGQGPSSTQQHIPDVSAAASPEYQVTHTPRKPAHIRVGATPNVNGSPHLPPTAGLARFGPTESVLAMPPPPVRRLSTNSSRPSTPSFQASPDNPLVPALGILSPGKSSIQVEPLYITTSKCEWGRLPTCTHVYKDSQDIRVPKSAFTIALWDPATGRKGAKDPNFDWSKSNYYAVISTNTSRAIFVNGIPITRKLPTNKVPLGLLYSGDKITIFDEEQNGAHLHFYVHFWSGAARHQRDHENNEFRVLLGEDALHKAIAEFEARLARVAKH